MRQIGVGVIVIEAWHDKEMLFKITATITVENDGESSIFFIAPYPIVEG